MRVWRVVWVVGLLAGLPSIVAGGDVLADAGTSAILHDYVAGQLLLVTPAKLKCGIVDGKPVCVNTNKTNQKDLDKILKQFPGKGNKQGKGKEKEKENKSKGKDNGKSQDAKQQGSCPKGYVLVQSPNGGASCETDPDLIAKPGQTEICCTIQVTEADGSPASSPAYIQCRNSEAAARDATATFAQSNSFIIKSTSCAPK